VVEVDGIRYYGDSEPEERVPVTGEVVHAVVPGCHDTGGPVEPDEQVTAQVIEDVPVAVAVLRDGVVHVREGARLPASAGAWFPSASCTGSEELALAGRWEEVSEPAAPHFDGVLDPPYDVGIRVQDGPRRYRGDVLDLQVTSRTEPALARDLDRARLGVGRLEARVRCAESGFVAVSLRLS
jgi:hypothetical protein